ncbi:MAG: Lin0512 family protein [Methylobacteriaceae bacterium]|nr:Lin0512 family protein [Methylobacteriaceae bacterium]MBV9243319.1 Lin0512 family protein [Methylobacteriaceae bacterium]
MRQVVLIEIGMGVDLQGQDATKASVRAVRDAIGRIYLPGLRPFMTGGAERVEIVVRLAVPDGAGKPDPEAVRSAFPHRPATIEMVPGGMLTPNGLGDGHICIVNAAVEVAVQQ